MEDRKLPIHKCQATGLLYIDEVPFTREHLKKIKKFFKYGNKVSSGQFKHEITITDSNGGAKTVIDADLISDIFKLWDVSDIASDKHFTM